MASLPEDEEMQLFGTMALKNLALNDEVLHSGPHTTWPTHTWPSMTRCSTLAYPPQLRMAPP